MKRASSSSIFATREVHPCELFPDHQSNTIMKCFVGAKSFYNANLFSSEESYYLNQWQQR